MAELTIKIQGLSRRQTMLMVGGAALSVSLAVAAIAYIRHYTAWVGLPQDSYNALSFAVYFPKHPPAGFKFDIGSVSSKPDVLVYSFKYQSSKPVYVSIQPKDQQLDVHSFNPTRTFSAGIGDAYLADFDARTTVAILAGKSMVLINSPDGIPDAAVEQFADSLAPVR